MVRGYSYSCCTWLVKWLLFPLLLSNKAIFSPLYINVSGSHRLSTEIAGYMCDSTWFFLLFLCILWNMYRSYFLSVALVFLVRHTRISFCRQSVSFLSLSVILTAGLLSIINETPLCGILLYPLMLHFLSLSHVCPTIRRAIMVRVYMLTAFATTWDTYK